MESKVKELARLSEEVIAIDLMIDRLQPIRVIMNSVKRSHVSMPVMDELIKSLRETRGYCMLQCNALLEELSLSTVLPRCSFSSTELKEGYVQIEQKPSTTVIFSLRPYSDKNRTINPGQIVELPAKENYILERLGSALSQGGMLLKYRSLMRHPLKG